MGKNDDKIERLKQRIEDECLAMKRQLDDQQAKPSHAAISQQYYTLDCYHEQLKTLVGEQEATMILYEIYSRILQ
jgi:hypothetical protein